MVKVNAQQKKLSERLVAGKNKEQSSQMQSAPGTIAEVHTKSWTSGKAS
jgi:hypothetical protein